MKILIVAPSWIGDTVAAQALFMRLESELPDYYQVFLANSQGDLLLYPDGKKRQDSPHGPQYRLHEELPLTRSLVEGEAQNLLTRLPATRKQPGSPRKHWKNCGCAASS